MIKTLFKKDIDRNINGVIMADNLSDDAVFQEVDEYVITNDLNTKLDDFFSTYSESIGEETQDIGVWLSGHFGSGKSHLLKILSYILTNKREHSDLIGELFLTKIPTDDFELKNNIEKALNSPSDTILFNIDQKSDTANKKSDDAILGVFMKVFNEMRGYYPKFGHIAKFESEIDKKGKFELFKEKFEEYSGESWETGRETIFLEIDSFAKALAEVDNISEESAKTVMDKYEDNYSLSIEDFAKEVRDYISTKPANYRLVFCVDEVGQYIGDNTKLMLNLQTIVETLSTVCKGQAWVIVTSQAAVDDLVGSNTKMQNDFSKIMGRFKLKLNLTSQNANEVIQKRLLEKTGQADSDLKSLYSKVENSLASIIHFSDRTRQYNSYKGADDFANVYPFIPYQMDLFQSCITGLSKHNVFHGKHQSVGERSMLNVMQNISQKLSSDTIGTIATFDMFYDALTGIIRSDVQTQIQKAGNILTEFEYKVLKALFMIKYVKEFTSSIENITTLLVDSVESVNVAELKTKIQGALDRLINQTYIQKVGERYEFLTNAEKDIEQEIKAIDVSDADCQKELASWIFDDIIKINKIRYQANKQDYPFARKLDDEFVKSNKNEELCLNVLSPLNIHEHSENSLIAKSLQSEELILALPGLYEFTQDLKLYMQTKVFIPQKQGGSISPDERTLLFNKADDNNRRKEKLLNDLREFIADSTFYFKGSDLPITKKDIKAKVDDAFESVINQTYSYLSQLPKIYEEKDIVLALKESDDIIDGIGDTLGAPEQEIYGYIERKNLQHSSVTISDIINHFNVRPYGWYQNATLTLLAFMFVKHKIDIKQNSSVLNKDEVRKNLTNSRMYASCIVSIRKTIGSKKTKDVLNILRELYPESSFSNANPREIYTTAKITAEQIISRAREFMNTGYSFKSVFQDIITKLTNIKNCSEDDFFDYVIDNEDEILDFNDDVIVPVLEFMGGEKRKIYDSVISFLNSNKDNLRYITNDNVKTLYGLQDVAKPYTGRHMQDAKASLGIVTTELERLIADERAAAKKIIETQVMDVLRGHEDFDKIPQDDKVKVLKASKFKYDSLDDIKNIDSIRQRCSQGELSDMIMFGYNMIENLSAIPDVTKNSTLENIKTENVVIPVQKSIKFSSILPKNNTRVLKTEDDVNRYVEQLKNNLIKEIQDNKKIFL